MSEKISIDVVKLYSRGWIFLRDIFLYLFPGAMLLIILLLYDIIPTSLIESLSSLPLSKECLRVIEIVAFLAFSFALGHIINAIRGFISLFFKCERLTKETSTKKKLCGVSIIKAGIIVFKKDLESYKSFVERYNLVYRHAAQLSICFLLTAIIIALMPFFSQYTFSSLKGHILLWFSLFFLLYMTSLRIYGEYLERLVETYESVCGTDSKKGE